MVIRLESRYITDCLVPVKMPVELPGFVGRALSTRGSWLKNLALGAFTNYLLLTLFWPHSFNSSEEVP